MPSYKGYLTKSEIDRKFAMTAARDQGRAEGKIDVAKKMLEKNMDISNYEVTLTDVAKEEIENIYAYILENLHEEIAANKLMDKIEDGVLRLAQNPYSCPKVKVKPHNEIYRKLIINNYIVLYDIDKEYKKTVIYRVIHEKTDYLKLLEN